MLQSAMCRSSADCCNLRVEGVAHRNHIARMGKVIDPVDREAGNNLRAWREFREMTQADLAARVDTTPAVISLLEAGSRKLSPKWLRRLAPALDTSPGFLLEHNPYNLPTDFLREWDDIPAENREQALKVLAAFKRAG